jgi:uncharacterized protein YodC (DUF2158 family)
MAEFQSGDLVKLKSGGPLMTISFKNSHGSFVCVWWNENSEAYKSETFAPALIESAKKDNDS